MKIIRVDRCSRCPYRIADKVVVDGTMDLCVLKQRGLDYRACLKKGEFPKTCPLPNYEEKKK